MTVGVNIGRTTNSLQDPRSTAQGMMTDGYTFEQTLFGRYAYYSAATNLAHEDEAWMQRTVPHGFAKSTSRKIFNSRFAGGPWSSWFRSEAGVEWLLDDLLAPFGDCSHLRVTAGGCEPSYLRKLRRGLERQFLASLHPPLLRSGQRPRRLTSDHSDSSGTHSTANQEAGPPRIMFR
jgi:hypothetical protein